MPTFEFLRVRFHFQAVEPVLFPPGGSANLARGACGIFLRRTAPPAVYSRFFEPGRALGPSPSGLADWPRPFVFRAAHLDGLSVAPHEFFSFDLHVFDLQHPAGPFLEEAFTRWAASGIGPRRGRARLDRVERLGLDEQPAGDSPCSLPLDPEPRPLDRIEVSFVTPTELKTGGQLIQRPEFAALFARLRDRICTLRARFGQGPLELDFGGMGERAAAVALERCELRWETAARTSSRTRQTHPLSGFTGEVEYRGVLQEFAPWLRVARWTGVGRHTSWGNGEVHILRESANLNQT